MNVDLDAIAQRGRCDVASLRNALPLIEQGYAPPFLARYRRDELGGVDEPSLWALAAAVSMESSIAQRRDELIAGWEKTTLQDPAIGQSIRRANSTRMLERIGRRLKSESSEHVDAAVQLAVRLLNPQKGDGDDLNQIAGKIEGVDDAGKAVEGIEQALAQRILGDPRLINSAVRWLVKNAKIHISAIHDPHTSGDESESDAPADVAPAQAATSDAGQASEVTPTETAEAEAASGSNVASESAPADPAEAQQPPTAEAETPAAPAAAEETQPTETSSDAAPAVETPAAEAPAEAEAKPAEESKPTDASETAEAPTAEPPTAETKGAETKAAETKAAEKQGGKGNAKAGKKAKKISPRQRRRRWLVSVLKPLEGKRIAGSKLSSFQIVMLARALRSQVAQCSFEYDASKLVAELQRTAGGFNRHLEAKLRETVLQHEADIREAAEAAWWDELQERASTRLVGIAAEHLRRQTDRGAITAKVIMSIDAVGPRTAATAIVAADGRLLHNEDLPCQLASGPRQQAVSRMGELIHTYHVDLIVISNGPSRRATMVAVGDLIEQSPASTLRWTLADRSGADAYAGSAAGDQEMKTTPRRFRAAAWLAFSVLQPAQALAKVDPLKLRLGSFQRELSDQALQSTLENVMISGASRGGVDVNSASPAWLTRLPGMSEKIAEEIDTARRNELFTSRDSVAELEGWPDSVSSRQALPFLRVFNSEESLDGTLVHPDDYALAKKLAAALDLELPPQCPPGYEEPNFDEPEKKEETPVAAEEVAAESSTSELSVETAEPDPNFGGELTEATEAEPKTDDAASSSGEAETEAASSEAEESAGETPSEPAAEEAASSGEAESTAETSESTEAADSGESTAETSASSDAPAPEATAAPEAAPPAPEVHAPIRHPLPEEAKINKCIKEWQVGANRVRQLVSSLCDPFGDGDFGGTPPAVLSTMPSLKSLKQGDQVIGVVVGVMPFGVFVELAPDCSGLIHVSKVSDGFVEDLHEAVQVGDVVTAWVTGVDEKRRRVALSAISPQREAELQEQKRHRDSRGDRGGRGGGRGGDKRRGGGRQGGDREQGARGGGGGGQGRGQGQGRGRQGAGKPGGAKPRGGDGRGGNRSRDQRGGGRRRDKKPESYRVVSKEPAKPITDAMQKGDEPMRSFGDLMQFFSNDEQEKKKPQDDAKPAESTPAASQPADPPAADPPEATEAAPPSSDDSKPAAPEAAAPQTPEPAKSDSDAASSSDAKPDASGEPTTPSDTTN